MGILTDSLQYLWYPKIPYLNGLIRIQKYVICFNISMNNLILMDMLEPQTQLYKPIGYYIFINFLFLLLMYFDNVREFTLFTVLHNDNHLLLLNEGFKVFNYKRTVKFTKYLDFLRWFLLLLLLHFIKEYFFGDEQSAIGFVFDEIGDTKGTATESLNLVVFLGVSW